MKKWILIMFGALLTAGGGVLSLAFLLQNFASYRSPLYSSEPEWTPYDQAQADQRRERDIRLASNQISPVAGGALDPPHLAELGKEIVHGRGLCLNCHSIGDTEAGTQGPNLEGIGQRAAQRVAGLSAVEYLAQSLYYPDAFVVDGFVATMLKVDEVPIGLDDDEIVMVIAYLQSLGGVPTVTANLELRPPEPVAIAAGDNMGW